MALRTKTGFTIVELLIVIVVIAILAAITVVAYNGISNRADFSKKQSDLAAIVKALELYKTDNGRYPNSENCDTNYGNGWCGWDQGTGESFIPGLSPKYMTKIPSLDPSLPYSDTYLYKASSLPNGANDGGGNYYQLMRYRDISGVGLAAYELQGNTKIMPDYPTTGWGYQSDPVAMAPYDW